MSLAVLNTYQSIRINPSTRQRLKLFRWARRSSVSSVKTARSHSIGERSGSFGGDLPASDPLVRARSGVIDRHLSSDDGGVEEGQTVGLTRRAWHVRSSVSSIIIIDLDPIPLWGRPMFET